MNLLILGRGKGSWEMRGQQLGAALGARVTSGPTDADWHWAERVIFVKRPDPAWLLRARALKLATVWDALDFWRQPAENGLSEKASRVLLQRQIEVIQPSVVVGATRAMAEATGGMYLPHHGRLGLRPTPAREALQVVGYDGNSLYLGTWAEAIQQACRANGWQFVVNPPDLSAVDVLVALRDGPWDGWMCREWKSGVKYVNAMMAGRPIITQASAGQRELAPAATVVSKYADIPQALDAWHGHAARAALAEGCRTLAEAFTVEAVAASYRRILGDEAMAA